MESLKLPRDLNWDGKMEPKSPSSEMFSLSNNEESWIFEDSFAKDILFFENDDTVLFDLTTTKSCELILECEYDDLKKENWLEAKPDYTQQHYINYGTNSVVQPIAANPQLVKVQNDYDMIMNFESLYNTAEFTQLTPPQTPPQKDISAINNELFDFPITTIPSGNYHDQIQMQIHPQRPHQQVEIDSGNNVSSTADEEQDLQEEALIMLLQQQHEPTPNCSPLQVFGNAAQYFDGIQNENHIPAMSPTNSVSDYSSDSSNLRMSPDIARELEIVDEIVRNRSRELPDLSNDDSMFSMCSSSAVSLSNDEDWLPSGASVSSRASNSFGNICAANGNDDVENFPFKNSITNNDGAVTKKRVRPYGRGIEDKKSRKKEQNKNAATRYRLKKKQQMEDLQEEEKLLSIKNEELREKFSSLKNEIKYLKDLIRESCKRRELIV